MFNFLFSAPKQNTLINNDVDDSESDKSDDETNTKKPKEESVALSVQDIRTMNYTIICGILYVALNLDKSEIQLSHFLRHVREGRLTFRDFKKFIPSEINFKRVPQWWSFQSSILKPSRSNGMHKVTSALFQRLDLGSPLIPDMKAMVSNYIKELCLPKDFLNLVLSLFEFMPIEAAVAAYLKISSLTLFPNFDCIAMSYVLVALKMCFGLDDNYEVKLSDVVDKINEEENHLKTYRLEVSEPSERLFSFREWVNYLEFRKIILCQYYQPMAALHNFEQDNFTVSELLKDIRIDTQIKTINIELEQELLERIPIINSYDIIPKEEFPVSLTPLTAYTEFLISKIHDPQTKLLLSEDFSKYSLKYACVHMMLTDNDGNNIVKGVNEENKTKSKRILGSMGFQHVKLNKKIVYIKNTDTKDWINDYKAVNVNSDKENLSGDESKEDVLSKDRNETKTEDIKREDPVKCETVEELDEDENIFNDNFEEIEYSQERSSSNDCIQQPEYVFEFNDAQLDNLDTEMNVTSRDLIGGKYNPTTFNKEEVIKQLILTACRTYKIAIPYHYRGPRPVKRKSEKYDERQKQVDEVKRRRLADPQIMGINEILSKYHDAIQRNEPENATSETDPIEGNTTQDNDPELNTTIENTDEPPNLNNETEPNVEDTTENNISIENETINDTIDDDDSEKEINELLKECDEDIEEYLIDDEVNAIIRKALADSEKNQKERFKLLKEKLQERKKKLKRKGKKKQRKKRVTSLDPLIPNPDSVEEFKYYVRHYVNLFVSTNIRRTYSFERELTENCPKSFKYILQLCASMIEVPAWNLFRVFQNLETYMIKQAESL